MWNSYIYIDTYTTYNPKVSMCVYIYTQIYIHIYKFITVTIFHTWMVWVWVNPLTWEQMFYFSRPDLEYFGFPHRGGG